MDLAQQLVRSCVRAFYDTKHILVIDALVIHSALRDDDLAYLMCIHTKELHKLCGRLREDRFLAVHTRAEIREGQARPQSRTYYYIDYRATIDAIKWRIFLIDKEVQGATVPLSERKEYFCSRCKSEWTQMEVLDKWSPNGFLCHMCGFLLQHDPDNNRGGHEQSSKLNAQFKFITERLPKIDQVVIPENNFEHAISSALPVLRDATHPASQMVPAVSSVARPTAVKGMTNTGFTSISVTLTTSDGPSEVEIAAERARKQAHASQNALPVHFTHSTISGEQVKFGQDLPSQSTSSLETEKKDTTLDTPSINGDAAEIDDYFARLKAEQAREAAAENEEENETDDDEEEEEDDEFETVLPNGITAGTPSSSTGNGDSNAAMASLGMPGILKKSPSASGSGTGAATPLTGLGSPAEDGRASKRVKIEEPSSPGGDEESEEDMEFEDV